LINVAILSSDNLLIGFGHKPFPGDYRSEGRLIADQDLES
jgi:hypothetical protein